MTEQTISHLINKMMDICEPHLFMRLLFEKSYVKEGYELDWNKRLVNCEWKDKGDIDD